MPHLSSLPSMPPSSSTFQHAFVDVAKPTRPSVLYSSTLLLVTLGMVLLPLFYVGLFGLLVYGVVAHLVILSHSPSGVSAWSWLMSLAPACAGATLAFFMAKPLLSRAPEEPTLPELPWEQEGKLYSFVSALCQHLGTPVPVALHVDCSVNARVSIRPGGMASGGMVLQLGLPLVAGLSLQQLTAILAHEFGHISHTLGARPVYLIRVINQWFSRVVLERDDWDDTLDYYADEHPFWLAQIPAILARLLVRLTRRILWVLMLVGHGISAVMLRRMELDADRIAARISGSDIFCLTLQERHKMELASGMAFGVLQEQWTEGRLCKNIPQLTVLKAAEMPSDIEEILREQWEEEETHWYDFFPPMDARLRAVAKLQVPGLVAFEGPATQLFVDFTRLAESESLLLYQQMFGGELERMVLVAPDELLRLEQQFVVEAEAGVRVWRQVMAAVCPIPAATIVGDLTLSLAEAKTQIATLRQQAIEQEPLALASFKSFVEQREGLSTALRMRELLQSDIPVSAEEFGVTEATIAAALQKEQTHRNAAEDALAGTTPFVASQCQRFSICLSLWNSPLRDELPGVTELYTPAQIDALLDAMAALYEVREALGQLFERFELVQWYMHIHELVEELPEPLMILSSSLIKRVGDDLGALRNQLRGVPYPFVHAQGDRSVGQYLVPDVPASDDSLAILQQLEAAIHGLVRLYVRSWGALSRWLESIEEALGYEAMEAPEDPFLEDLLTEALGD